MKENLKGMKNKPGKKSIRVYRYKGIETPLYLYFSSWFFLFIKLSNRKLQIFFLLLLFLVLGNSITVFSQTDWIKWGKADYSYTMPDKFRNRDYTFDESSPQRFILSSLGDAYWYVISDVDGDNCSFSPTCSSFFLKAVKRTNIVQGTLMFFDRFTRDMDVYKKYEHYPRVRDGHYYDPVSLYALDKNKIKYIPPFEVVNSE